MADDTDDPMTPSGDYSAMCKFWDMVDSILGGAETMRATMGAHTSYSVSGPAQPVGALAYLNRGLSTFPQSPYLPAFPNEGQADYEMRRRHAPFTNIYEDISDNLSAKPFAKECALDEKTPEDLKKLSEDIDGQGHSLHVFAKDTFKDGLDRGIDWILVDYTKVPQGATLADERSMGARPYWVRIQAQRMLAVYSTFLGGKETIYHARIHEPVTVKNGYSEECVDRVRVLNREAIENEAGEIIALGPASWELYEKQEETDPASGKKTVAWVSIGQGPITIGIIPLVPFIPVGRLGMSWKVKPAFHDIAYMQVEEFQQESNLKSIKELTAFPMLSGNGVTPPTDASGQQVTVPVGPRGVLFAPMGGDGRFGNWSFIEPTAQSLTFLQSDLDKLREEMRNLGRQPLTNANLTVITTANVSMKAHSAVQAWALLLKDALEQAWIITCMWLGRKEMPVVNVHMDFAVDFEAGTELVALQQAEASGTISKRLHFEEMKRRGVLSDDADWDKDQTQAATEQEGQQLQPEKMIDPVTGAPIVVTPQHGVPNPPPKSAAPKPTVN
jgi:hypothetical protein